MPSRSDDDLPSSDRKPHLVSASKAAALFGRNRSTITDWIAAGCPVERQGGDGSATLLDPAAVLEWREKVVREKASAKNRPASDAGLKTGLSFEDMKAIEDIRAKRLASAIKARKVVSLEAINHGINQAHGAARQSLMSLPDMNVRILLGSVEKAKLDEVYDAAFDLCATALEAWRDRIVEAAQKAAEMVMEFDDADDDLVPRPTDG